MEINLLNAVLDRQMTTSQIEVLEELYKALYDIDNASIEDAFKAEAPNHHVFDVCYKEDSDHLIERVEEEFPNLEGYIEQLSCEDYVTDHDKFNNMMEENEAKDALISKINDWKDSVNLFIENVSEMY